MKIEVNENRYVKISDAEGTQNENNITQIQIIVPEKYADYNKKIVFLYEGQVIGWDIVENNTYIVKKSVTKHRRVQLYIWLTKGEDDFRSATKEIEFNENQDASNEITDEEMGRVNTVINLLEEEIAKATELEKTLTELITTVQTKLDNGEFNGQDGQDYVLTEDDKQEIAGITKPMVEETIKPTLDNNLQESKSYADSIKPTKTSELTNDSDYAKTNENNNFSTAQTINGTLTINGNIVQNGESYETHAEHVNTKKNEIILRDGAVGGMSINEFAGLIATLYNGIASGRLGFKADGTAYVGDVGDEQPLLTRDDVLNLQEGQVLVWDGTNLKAVGSSDFIKKVDVASMTDTGVIKAWTSTNDEGEIGLNISTEV